MIDLFSYGINVYNRFIYMLFSKRFLDTSQTTPWTTSYKCFTDKATSYPDDHSFLKGKVNDITAEAIFLCKIKFIAIVLIYFESPSIILIIAIPVIYSISILQCQYKLLNFILYYFMCSSDLKSSKFNL